ncbi:MAG: 3-oxoacyl-ACP reductase family protein [Planctomycetota bacterium]|jgi:3-oxoacyl-[acyl-carrier protein] reductase
MTTTSTTPPHTGKVALITGGSRGIGAGIAQRLAADGADIAFTYARNAEAAQQVIAAVEAHGRRALAIQADSGDADQVRAAVERTVSDLGRLDILVNNAGVLHFHHIDDFTLADFDESIAVNQRGVFVASQAAAKHMASGSRIINIGSVNADSMPTIGGAVYSMSKAAVAGLTKGLARDLGPRGITVNNVQPGPIDTDMNPADGDLAAALTPLLATGRYGTTAELASFVSYLAGPESAYITGASLNVDGGFTI